MEGGSVGNGEVAVEGAQGDLLGVWVVRLMSVHHQPLLVPGPLADRDHKVPVHSLGQGQG